MTRPTEACAGAGLAGALAIAGALAAAAQEPPAPQFPAETAAITVDVLVLDDGDRPVQGLKRDDFVIFEDGRVQTIVGFEARDVAGEGPRGEAGPLLMPEIATNDPESAAPGRVFVLLIDDLGLSAITVAQLVPRLSDWISRKASDGDEITIMTTSGDVWWSDTVGRGREDLLSSLGRVKGKKLVEPQVGGAMSVWEGYQIAEVLPAIEPEFSLRNRHPQFHGSTIFDRVLQRWFDQRACECPPDPYDDCKMAVRSCLNRAQLVAREKHGRWTARARAALVSLGNLSRSLAGIKGRKSVLLLSEEFLADDSLAADVREALVALQRGNVTVYFLGALGLTGNAAFSAEQDVVPRAQDVMRLGVEQTTLALEGGTNLSEATGGVAITSSNDLAAGLERMALDASSYYLLGYQPEEAPDGKWHKLEVKVARPGLKVRARQRYLAERPEDVARAAASGRESREKGNDKDKGEKLTKRELPPAVLTGSARGSLPLRLGVYLKDTDHFGSARVQIALEIDNSRVQVDKTVLPWRATLDFTVLTAGLSRPPAVPIDERLQLSLNPRDVGNGWWLVPREIWLPPGVTQIRVFARDTLSKTEGVVTERLVVPDLDQPYLSTPIITDRTLPAPKAGEPPRLVPTAQRRFGRERPLLCQFEVFAFAGRTLEGVPQLVGGYTLQRAEGQIVSSDPPTPIETDGFRAVRRITLPVERLEEGAYLLEVRVEDRLAQRALVSRAPFVIEGGQTAEAPGAQGHP